MPEYELRLRFTAANGLQASRLAEAWADTCAAEYGTRYRGVEMVDRFCVTLGHETVPAAEVGTYDDGKVVYPGTAYCAKCAEVMSASGDWTAGSELSTHPVDVSAVACAWCGRAVVLGEHPVLDGEEWFCSHECDDACTDQTPSASGT